MVNLKKVNWSRFLVNAAHFLFSLSAMFFMCVGVYSLFVALGAKDFIITVVGLNVVFACVLVVSCVGVVSLKLIRDFWRGRGGK